MLEEEGHVPATEEEDRGERAEHGHLHELSDQLGTLDTLVKWTARIERPQDAGDIVNEGSYGPDSAPDWDGADFAHPMPRHPDGRAEEEAAELEPREWFRSQCDSLHWLELEKQALRQSASR